MGLTTWTIAGWTAYMGFPAVPDGDGCTWWATVDDGWRTPPAPRLSRVTRPRRHGEVDPGRTWLPGRSVELKGLVEAPDHPTLVGAGERFAGLLAAGSLSTLVVDEDGVVRQADARLADQPTFAPVTPNLAAWSLPLLMPDPLRYGSGEPVSASTTLPAATVGLVVPSAVPWVFGAGGTSGGLVVANTGTAPTWPEFTILGPVVNPRIEHATSGRVLSFTTELSASDTLTVRTATGEVLLNGAENARNAVSSDSSPVTSVVFDVGLNEVFYRAVASAGGSFLTISFRAAFF